VTTVTVDNTVADTTAPTCSITSPANGATIQSVISINANANDNVAVTKVEFYEGINLIGTASVSPYSIIWDTTKVANGNHNIQVKAYDAANNVGTSAVISVTVDNVIPDTTAPICTITSPANGATVQGTTTISAFTNDNVGVTKVQFYVGGSLIGTTLASPYNIVWDTTKVANGNYTIQVEAYDAAENMGTSEITVTVNNSIPDKAPPTLNPSTKNNVTGKAITITFTENTLWRSAITDILVNGTSIKGKYTVSAGKIVIQSGVFTSAGTYTVTVKANGYLDATVNQTIRR